MQFTGACLLLLLEKAAHLSFSSCSTRQKIVCFCHKRTIVLGIFRWKRALLLAIVFQQQLSFLPLPAAPTSKGVRGRIKEQLFLVTLHLETRAHFSHACTYTYRTRTHTYL
jgi:hypothetical protein